MPMAFPPWARTAATVASAASGSTSLATARAPSRAKASAPARPRPDPAPVMTTTRSWRRMGCRIAQRAHRLRLCPKVPDTAHREGGRARTCKVSRRCIVRHRLWRPNYWVLTKIFLAFVAPIVLNSPSFERRPAGGKPDPVRTGRQGQPGGRTHDASCRCRRHRARYDDLHRARCGRLVGPEPALRADRTPERPEDAPGGASCGDEPAAGRHHRLLRPEQHPDQHLCNQLYDHTDGLH